MSGLADGGTRRALGFRFVPWVCLFLIAVLGAVWAQESGSQASADGGSSASPQPSPPENGAERRHPSVARELNRESRESAGEGENAEFKHSASVRRISKATGLSVDQVYWLSVLVNFGAIAGVMVWLAKKNLPVIFRNRTAQIQAALEEARKASDEANRRLADIEARLSRLDIEIAELRAAAQGEGAAEESRVRAAAEEDARKIVESAGQEIATAAKLARRELTAYAARLAVSLAEKQIEISPATDQALVRGFVEELSSDGGARNGGG
jgi:F-type H+-transporting ATPase subunit b